MQQIMTSENVPDQLSLVEVLNRFQQMQLVMHDSIESLKSQIDQPQQANIETPETTSLRDGSSAASELMCAYIRKILDIALRDDAEKFLRKLLS